MTNPLSRSHAPAWECRLRLACLNLDSTTPPGAGNGSNVSSTTPSRAKTEYLSDFRGFTLIEVLVVMLIIGIITSVTLITYTPNAFKEERDRLNLLLDKINVLQEKAILESIPYGIVFFEEKYRIVSIQNNTWVEDSVLPGADIDLSNATLEANGELAYLDKSEFVQQIFPQIVMTPGAEITPFRFVVRYYDEEINQSITFEMESDILGRGKLTEIQ